MAAGVAADAPGRVHLRKTGIRLLHSLRQMDSMPASVRDFLGLAAAHIRLSEALGGEVQGREETGEVP